MSIEVTCPTCGAVLPAPEELAGKKIRCADCEGIVHVPMQSKIEPSASLPYAPPGEETVAMSPADDRDERAAMNVRPKPRVWDDQDRTPPGQKPGVLRGGAIAWLLFLSLLSAAGAGLIAWALVPVEAPLANVPIPPAANNPNPFRAVPNVAPPENPVPKVAIPEKEVVLPPKGAFPDLPKQPVPVAAIPVPAKEPPTRLPAPPPKSVLNSTPSPIEPSSIAGLKFHLAFETTKEQKVFESVRKEFVGKLSNGSELETGARGKAIKLAIPKLATGTNLPLEYALDLGDQKDRFAIEKDTPLTFCFWAKGSLFSTQIFKFGQQRSTENPRISLYQIGSIGQFYFHPQKATQSNNVNHRFTISNPNDWHHYALKKTRDGDWSFYSDGRIPTYTLAKGKDEKAEGKVEKTDTSSTTKPFRFNEPMPFLNFGLGSSTVGSERALYLDDFCWFDRDLTDREILKLAGKE